MPEEKNIKFEYKTTNENGLRPQVIVYYVDEEKKQCEALVAQVFPGVGVRTIRKDSRELGLEGCLTVEIDVFDSPIQGDYETEDEESFLRHAQDQRTSTVIKAYSSKDMRSIVDMHFDAYKAQFQPLADEFVKQFREFLKQNPEFFPLSGEAGENEPKNDQ